MRQKRKRPLTDTKVLTASNGLMIRGYADCGRLFDEPRYTQAAAKAAEFVLANLRTGDGRLLRTYAGGQAKLAAYLDDYAYPDRRPDRLAPGHRRRALASSRPTSSWPISSAGSGTSKGAASSTRPATTRS